MIIKNGTIVTDSEIYKADIKIEGEKIKEISKEIKSTDDIIIDAGGKFVIPGIIDVHTHFQLSVGGRIITSDNFQSGTRAAAFGGVTTFIDFATQQGDESLFKTLSKRKKEAENNCYIDYSFHIAVTNFKDKVFKEIKKLISDGIPSFKFYLIYKERGWMADDGVLLEAFKTGGMIMLHCENPFIIERIENRYISEKKTGCRYFGKTRPNFSEAEAINRAIYLRSINNGKLYIVHLSTREGLMEISRAKNSGTKIWAETCPQYLHLSNSLFNKKNGVLFATCPPIRSKEDIEALWSGIKQDYIDIISTDHCSFTFKQKKENSDDFRKFRFGMPGVETLLMLFFYSAKRQDISLCKIVEKLCTNPAKIFGLYPQKGTLMEGSDADIVIYNPQKSVTLSWKTLHQRTDYCPYEGYKIKGVPETVISRGEIILKAGRFYAKKGRGKYKKRWMKE